MSLLNFNIVTESGLNYITSAYNGGPLIAIKYFLPCYDYRIDQFVHDGSETSVIALSASVSATDTTPSGEKIWNISTDNAYTLSDTDDFVTSAGGETLDDSGDPWILTDAVISKEQKINLYNGVPLSNYVSGSDVDASATSNAWEIYDGALVVGNNDVPAETSAGSNRYFQVVDYYPVSDGSVLKGSFKCRLNKKLGTVKFNKIALYVVQVDNNGVETSSPALFAEAVIDSPITKTNYGTSGFEDIVIDVQIQIGSVTTNFSDVFYATSADYWSRTVGGVYYSEKVGIGVFDDGYEEMQNKLHIKESDATKPQLRLDYGIGTSALTSATFHTTSAGNLEITLSSNKAIQPKTTDSIDLGTSALEYRKVYATSANFDYLDDSGAGSIKVNKNVVPLTHNAYNLGTSTSRWENGYFNILESSASYSDYYCPNTNAVSYASLGSSSRIWKYLFADTLSNPNSTIKIAETIIPVTDERCGLGDSSHAYSAAYIKDLYLSKKNNFKTGEWYFLGNHTWYPNNGSFWNAVPTGFDKSYSSLYNESQWDYVDIWNWKFSVIGKTLFIKFTFQLDKSSNSLTGRTANICRTAILTGSNEGDLLNSIVSDKAAGIATSSNNHCFTIVNPQTSDPVLILMVKFFNSAESGFDQRNGFLFSIQKSSSAAWNSAARYYAACTLTYELS